ncbi:MAG: ATP-binding protein [Candidatus Omnitrophota bacterium]
MKKIMVGVCLFAAGSLASVLFAAAAARWKHASWGALPFAPVLIMTVVCLLVYKPLDLLFTRLFKDYFFKKKSYAHMTLMNFASDLALILDLGELANLVVNTFGEVLCLKTVALLVPNRVRNDYEIASAYGWSVSDAKRIRLREDSPLIGLIRSEGAHTLVRDRAVRTLAWQDANRLAHDFDSLRAGWLIPLFVKSEFVGAMAFSAARPEASFDEGDFHFFREFADATAKCVRNALFVSELKVANEELQDVQSHLLQSTKLAAIEQLATGLAHEIHNPLTIISGKAQVLLLQKDRNRLDQRIEEVLKTIVKQTKRAADITRKLLMFSQGSGAPKESLKLEQVLEDTIALVSYQTSLDGIEMTRKIVNAIPPVYANVHEMREVFLNLILNAVQSVGSKGKIHCEIHYQPQNQVIEILISDTGCGIPEDRLDKVFNPFYTTRSDGVGLGLFVTKQIVHRYGGSIRVESRPGQGSLFLVRLPREEVPASTVSAQKSFAWPLLKEEPLPREEPELGDF